MVSSKRKRTQTKRMKESKKQVAKRVKRKSVRRPFKPPAKTQVDETKDQEVDVVASTGEGETTDQVAATLPVVEDEPDVNQDLILTQTQSAPTTSDDQVQQVNAIAATGEGEEETLPDKPAGFASYVSMITTRKSTWIHSEDVITLMQTYLPNSLPSTWTMKRLLLTMVERYSIPIKKGWNCKKLAQRLDFYVINGTTVEVNPKQRWSNKLDMARLLIVMFGDEEAKSKYIQSRQLPNRQRLDDTKRRSVKVEYWVDVAKLYNDEEEKYMIDVEDDMVNMYLRAELKSVYRVPWGGAKLREQFRILRADYEGSAALRNYDKSGQNGENFYPDFQNNNPTHVMLHYLLRDMHTETDDPQGISDSIVQLMAVLIMNFNLTLVTRKDIPEPSTDTTNRVSY